jgi:hypothetical protein
MGNDIVELTRQIRIKAAKSIAAKQILFKPSERHGDAGMLQKQLTVVEKSLGQTRLMKNLKETLWKICIELNKNDREISFENLVYLCDIVLKSL